MPNHATPLLPPISSVLRSGRMRFASPPAWRCADSAAVWPDGGCCSAKLTAGISAVSASSSTRIRNLSIIAALKETKQNNGLYPEISDPIVATARANPFAHRHSAGEENADALL